MCQYLLTWDEKVYGNTKYHWEVAQKGVKVNTYMKIEIAVVWSVTDS